MISSPAEYFPNPVSQALSTTSDGFNFNWYISATVNFPSFIPSLANKSEELNGSSLSKVACVAKCSTSYEEAFSFTLVSLASSCESFNAPQERTGLHYLFRPLSRGGSMRHCQVQGCLATEYFWAVLSGFMTPV